MLRGIDLLNKLQGMSEEELDRPIYVFADHGGEFYSVNDIDIDELTTSYEYCLEEYYVHPDDKEDCDTELKKFISIS